MKRFSFLLVMVVSALWLSGCSTMPSVGPPDIVFKEREIEWHPTPKILGRIANEGGRSKYIEIGVKITVKGDSKMVLATGWTNFSNVGAGESRPFTIYPSGTVPPGTEIEWYWRWSTRVGEAMY